ncbi:hypothetical protein DXH47_11385 [Levilactobacillus suantsaii]|uniref:Uncharacterized protein n=1 Tax=Levilactobacillus suantsaii TaxID=2292255 RepID=A0A4Q0VG86_9LACO|nr:hypothetical protein DXH47_11385 [Levilactobacillus suantsaii]
MLRTDQGDVDEIRWNVLIRQAERLEPLPSREWTNWPPKAGLASQAGWYHGSRSIVPVARKLAAGAIFLMREIEECE